MIKLRHISFFLILSSFIFISSVELTLGPEQDENCYGSKDNYYFCACETKEVVCTFITISDDPLFLPDLSKKSFQKSLTIRLRDSESSLKYFPTRLISNISNSFEELIISSFHFTTITNVSLRVNPYLRVLEISQNEQLTTIGPEAFTSFPKLERLSLTSNNLSNLSVSTFSGLRSLKELKLSANQITSLPDNIFSDLSSLISLRLASNNIERISRETFHGLSSVRELELNRNRILFIKNDTFRDLIKLRSLELSRNIIDSLEPGAFYGLKSLETLDLSYNQLRSLPNGLLSFTPKLTDINLKQNNLSMLTEEFVKQLPKIVFLRDNPWVCNCLVFHFNNSDNGKAKCEVYSEFNAKSKPVEPKTMTFTEYMAYTQSNPAVDKKCKKDWKNFNMKEKRSHLAIFGKDPNGGDQLIISKITITLAVLVTLWF